MNRKILFRGIAVNTGNWVIGTLRREQGKEFILDTDSTIKIPRPLRPHIDKTIDFLWEEALNQYERNFPEWVQVLPQTVGQYTGLEAKNGQMIYEGDIVKDVESGITCVVYWDDTIASFSYTLHTSLSKVISIIPSNLEIIGTIHEKGKKWSKPLTHPGEE